MDTFTITFILALIVTRIGVYLLVLIKDKSGKPRPETELFGFRIHHYMYGIILGAIGYLINNTVLFAIGLALFIDELPFLLMRGKTHEDNYSIVANIGVAIFGGVIIFAKLL